MYYLGNGFKLRNVAGIATWKRCLTGSTPKEPEKPVVVTEVPGPRSHTLLKELNMIQVRLQIF